MKAWKKHFGAVIGSMFFVMTLVTVGAFEVWANKFDKGYLPPGNSAKARRKASPVIGTDGGIWRNRASAIRVGAIRVGAGDITGDNNRRRIRSLAPRSISQSNRNISKSYILPYIEQDNIYR
jgi:hypothetical protein